MAEAIIDRSTRLTKNLDLRLLVNTFNDRLQYENGSAISHWMDLLDSRMKERMVTPAGGQGVRAQQKAQELEVLKRIAALPTAERLDLWTRETGKSQAALYRRLAELNLGDSHFSQSA